jgi:hypothetical protein
MEQAAAQTDIRSRLQLIEPNNYTFKGKDIEVHYSATSKNGEPLMSYRDSEREVRARGKEIRQEQTELGTLVTLTLAPDADAGQLDFTLVLPRAVLGNNGDAVRLVTEGLITRTMLPPRLAIASGRQLQTYRVVRMKGQGNFIVS